MKSVAGRVTGKKGDWFGERGGRERWDFVLGVGRGGRTPWLEWKEQVEEQEEMRMRKLEGLGEEMKRES